MEKTKPFFKVVSDPFASEETWLPACQNLAPKELKAPFALEHAAPGNEPKGLAAFRNLVTTVALSSILGVSGGIVAGQAVYVMYYACHLVSLDLSGTYGFEPWGNFYYWFNQTPALHCHIPVLISYFIGYLAKANACPKNAMAVWLTAVIVYFACLALHPGMTHFDYGQVWLATGAVASILAYCLGKKVASSIALLMQPLDLIRASIPVFVSGALCLSLPFLLASFTATSAVCILLPAVAGWCVVKRAKPSSPSHASGLALSLSSPFVLAGLLHIPVTIWFSIAVWQPNPIDIATIAHMIAYFVSLPAVVILSGAAGGYLAGLHKKRSGHLPIVEID